DFAVLGGRRDDVAGQGLTPALCSHICFSGLALPLDRAGLTRFWLCFTHFPVGAPLTTLLQCCYWFPEVFKACGAGRAEGSHLPATVPSSSLGDVASFVLKLVEGLRGQTWAPDWVEELREADRQKEQTFREKAMKPVAQHLNPVRVLQLVEETLPDNSILVVDGGDFVGTAAHLVQPRGPLRWLDPGKEGLKPGVAGTVRTPFIIML
ncbi:uncharacterized protein LOC114010119, partial [Tupaia chinensis]|uniref:uncharacterized protein LOC114010119 n=1 Tax=Tupaia chinensis TaxID=246437 RepID=UPI000FFBE5DE